MQDPVLGMASERKSWMDVETSQSPGKTLWKTGTSESLVQVEEGGKRTRGRGNDICVATGMTI